MINSVSSKTPIIGYQNVSSLEQDEWVDVSRIDSVVQECIEAMKPLPRGKKEVAFDFVSGPLCRTGSLAKRILQTVPELSLGALSGVLGGVTSLFGLAGSHLDWREAVREERHSIELGDLEGQKKSEAKKVLGRLELAAGSLFLTDMGVRTFSPEAGAISGATAFPVAVYLSGLASTIGLIVSAHGFARCRSFQRNLKEMESPEEALKFLQSLLLFDLNEIHDLEKRYGKGEAFERAYRNGIEKKVRILKRRTSGKSLLLILNQSEEILRDLRISTKRQEALQKATTLVQMVLKENQFKTALFATALTASLLGLASLVLGAVVSSGAFVSTALGMAAASIWLALALYNWVATSKKWALDEGVATPMALASNY